MNTKVRKMVLCSLMAALMALCAWISIPIPPVAFTLQTFGVLMALGVLGGKWGCVSILLYLAMGTAGVPVFAGFRGGAAALLDATGGFLWGFLAGGLVCWAMEGLGTFPSFLLCQLTCYFCGCIWFSIWTGNSSLWSSAVVTVLPYLPFDAVKLWMARTLSRRIRNQLRI